MWSYDALYAKSKVFVLRGLGHDPPDSSEASLWLILALELLAKATLAKINPALLAASDRDGVNILYACGIAPPPKRTPISIATKEVYQRCIVVCKEFNKTEQNLCSKWAGWRNEELHSGGEVLEHPGPKAGYQGHLSWQIRTAALFCTLSIRLLRGRFCQAPGIPAKVETSNTV